MSSALFCVLCAIVCRVVSVKALAIPPIIVIMEAALLSRIAEAHRRQRLSSCERGAGGAVVAICRWEVAELALAS
jgi:hypothetical protein